MKRLSAFSLVLLAWACLPMASAEADQIVVHLLSPTLPVKKSAGTILVRPVTSEASISPQRVDVAFPGDVALNLPAGSYELAAEVPGWWAEPRVANLGHDTEISLSLRRTGTITAQIEPASAQAISIRFQAVEGQLSGEAHCSAIEPNVVRCTMPEGDFHLRFGLGGHVPIYKQHVHIDPEGVLKIGRLRFAAGASLSGFLSSKEADVRRARVTVTSAPPAARTTMTVRPAENGFFIVGPLPVGECTIRALEDGLLSPELKLVIREGLEARLPGPLILAKPRRLAVSITPTADPLGGAWSARLVALDGDQPRVAAEGTATLAGLWNVDDLPTGNYQLRVGPGRGPVWFVRDLKVSDLLTSEQVTIEPVRFQGKVRMSEKPLHAKLIFGGEHSTNPITFLSDEDGQFNGYLPRPEADTWDVTVQSSTPLVNVTLKARLERHESDQPASLLVSVPPTGIEGVVVDADGTPVKYALIKVMSQHDFGLTYSRADDQGRFSLYGLTADDYSIIAQAQGAESDLVRVNVSESDTRVTSLRLELSPFRRWNGRVVAADGRPVAGARIDIVPVDVEIISAPMARTDVDGNFSALLPSKTQLVDLRVAPPGFAWTSFRRPVTSEPITIIVDGRAGTLNLEFDRRQDLEPFIWHRGSAFGAFGLLAAWSAQLDDSSPEKLRVKISQIEPGDYTICLRPAADFDYRTSAPSGRCSSVILPPYGEASVRW